MHRYAVVSMRLGACRGRRRYLPRFGVVPFELPFGVVQSEPCIRESGIVILESSAGTRQPAEWSSLVMIPLLGGYHQSSRASLCPAKAGCGGLLRPSGMWVLICALVYIVTWFVPGLDSLGEFQDASRKDGRAGTSRE